MITSTQETILARACWFSVIAFCALAGASCAPKSADFLQSSFNEHVSHGDSSVLTTAGIILP